METAVTDAEAAFSTHSYDTIRCFSLLEYDANSSSACPQMPLSQSRLVP